MYNGTEFHVEKPSFVDKLTKNYTKKNLRRFTLKNYQKFQISKRVLCN